MSCLLNLDRVGWGKYNSFNQFTISEPLLTSEYPQLVDAVHSLIERFDTRHAMYGNKEYADLLWQVRLECLI